MISLFAEHEYEEVAKGVLRLDLTRCRQCLECEEVCPTGVLVMPLSVNRLENRLADMMGVCIMCRYCLTSCPDKALSLNARTDGESYS